MENYQASPMQPYRCTGELDPDQKRNWRASGAVFDLTYLSASQRRAASLEGLPHHARAPRGGVDRRSRRRGGRTPRVRFVYSSSCAHEPSSGGERTGTNMNSHVDLTNCDREPIHVSRQRTTVRISACAVVRFHDLHRIREGRDVSRMRIFRRPLTDVLSKAAVDAIRTIIEPDVNSGELIRLMLGRVRKSPGLHELTQEASRQVKILTGFDRDMVYWWYGENSPGQYSLDIRPRNRGRDDDDIPVHHYGRDAWEGAGRFAPMAIGRAQPVPPSSSAVGLAVFGGACTTRSAKSPQRR